MRRLVKQINHVTVLALLFLFYYLVIGPVAVVRKLVLMIPARAEPDSYWEKPGVTAKDRAYFRSPY